MKLNIEELARESGNIAAVEVQLATSNGAWASWNELRDKAFARLIVERCAQEAEALADKLLCVHDNEGASIALEARGNIRQLLED